MCSYDMISFVGIFFHVISDWDIVCEMEVKIILHSESVITVYHLRFCEPFHRVLFINGYTFDLI